MNVFHGLEHATHVPWVIWSALFAGALLLVTGMVIRSRLVAANGGVVPDEGFTLRNAVELLVEMLSGLAEENMGPNWRKYFPFIGTLFLFILFSNLLGLIPTIDGATSSAGTACHRLALAANASIARPSRAKAATRGPQRGRSPAPRA